MTYDMFMHACDKVMVSDDIHHTWFIANDDHTDM